MKRCPQCGREYDLSMSFCLDDGTELLYGPAAPLLAEEGWPQAGVVGTEERATAILLSMDASADAPTRVIDPQTTAPPVSAISSEPPVDTLLTPNRIVWVLGGLAVVIVLASFLGYRYYNSAPTEQIGSIAILPLQNTSGNADSEYLCDGLAESLIYRLSQLPDLKVSPASSVMRYKGREFDAQKIAAELGVQAVVSGRMVQRGDSLSISVELIDAANNKTVWGEQFERKMSDLLATQREIVSSIVDKLQLKLSGVGTQGVTKNYTDSNDAYQSFLKGRYFLNKRNQENLEKAIAEFQAAVSKDPKFALAFVGLSETKAVMPFYSNDGSDASLREAKTYAQRALQIDDSLGEAHSSMGYAEMYLWNWPEAERELKRGIELNPNYSIAHKFYGNYLSNLGRFEEAAVALRRAQELEPLSLIVSVNLGDAYLEQGSLKAAVEQFQRAVDLDPNWHVSRRHLALVYLKQGRHADAVAESERAVELSGRQSVTLGFMGYVYTQAGKRDEALQLIEELKERYKSGQANGYDIARIYVGLDDRDKVFEWLEKDFASRNAIMAAWLFLTPFATLRDDPRFVDISERLGMYSR